MNKFFLVLLLLCVAVQAEAANFRDELLKLGGIVSVDVITQSPDEDGAVPFKEKYIAWFEQPIDWSNSDGGKFLQRVEIGYQGMDNVNVAYVGGYNLSDKHFRLDDSVELVKMYNANFISFEYRYYGLSMPEGLSDDVPAMWEHLTNKNAANDFHNVMEQLRGILSGNWAFTGASKGGQTTNIFAYYYPNDADVYVPYVAPLCYGTEDHRLPEAVYTSIGNERYGESKAKQYRDIAMKYIVEMIRERKYIQPRYYNLISDDVPYGREDMYISADSVQSYDIRYEADLVDIPVGMWQYDKNFDSFDEVLNMPKSTSNDKELYLREMLRLLKENDSADDKGDDEEKTESPRIADDYAYWVQVQKENGAYGIMFKYFREAVEKEGLTLKFKEEDEPGYYARTYIKPNLLATLSYDSTLSDNIRKWSHTTESKVIMIYGSSDPWYFVRMEDVTDNPNVRVFTADYGHGAEISMLKSKDKAAATEILDTQLQSYSSNGEGETENNGTLNQNDSQNNGQQNQTNGQSNTNTNTNQQEMRGMSSSSGSCNFTGAGALMLSALLVFIHRKK